MTTSNNTTPNKRKTPQYNETILHTPSAIITKGTITPTVVKQPDITVKAETDNKQVLSTTQIAQCRIGYTELISVTQFRAAYLDTIKSLNELLQYCNNTTQYNSIFDCNDINIQIPHDIIQTAVTDEVQRIADLEIQYKHNTELMKQELQAVEQEQLQQQQHSNNEMTDTDDTQTEQHTDGHSTDIHTQDTLLHNNNDHTIHTDNTATDSTKKSKRKTKKPKDEMKTSTEESSDDDTYDFTEDADFGLQIPMYNELMKSLEPLTQQRKNDSKLPVGRVRTITRDSNTINKQMIQHETHTAIEHAKHYNIDPTITVSDSEVLLHVHIYDKQYPGIRTNEFIVLGSQPLTALRDRIYCLNNNPHCQIDLNHPHNVTQLDTYSSYFFFEDVFYDDLRDQRAIRLSDNVVQWQQHNNKQLHNTHIHQYTQSTMHTTLFADLSIRLGTHYTYVHNGDCTHTVIFTQCRMKNHTDYNNVLAYPLKIKQRKYHRNKCNICNFAVSNYVVYNDLLSHINPLYVCTLCHQNLHLDKQGQTLYTDYQLYPYIHS